MAQMLVKNIPVALAKKLQHATEVSYKDLIQAREEISDDIHIDFGKNGIPAQELLGYLKSLDD